jgi:hypothetical protein
MMNGSLPRRTEFPVQPSSEAVHRDCAIDPRFDLRRCRWYRTDRKMGSIIVST